MTRIASLVLLAACWCARPTRARCPPGWYVNGARPSGEFGCRPVLGRPQDDLMDAQQGREIHDDRAIAGRLYCTGGATAHQDGTSVWCQR